jgi:hypothetical protein
VWLFEKPSGGVEPTFLRRRSSRRRGKPEAATAQDLLDHLAVRLVDEGDDLHFGSHDDEN